MIVDTGHIRIGGETFVDTATRICIPAEPVGPAISMRVWKIISILSIEVLRSSSRMCYHSTAKNTEI